MIAPDADRVCFSEHSASCLYWFPHRKHVTDHNDLVHTLILKAIERDLKVIDVFMDVGYEA